VGAAGSFTRRFTEIGAADLEVAGGKGANLGELTRAGLPVPPGFVITTAAYDAFVADNALAAAIAEAASRPADDDTAGFEAAAKEIGALFRGGALRPEIADAVDAAGAELGADAVAVRSSATAEDLAGASFAGQQDTYLDVRGPAAVRAAVVDCWASLWTARAMAYRRRQGIAPEAVSLAVVVQAMVDADSSGVLFTANPANGRRDQVAVSAAWGLGESVVGGTVSPDDVVLDKATGAVLTRHVADKTEMTVSTGAGSATRPVPERRRRAAVLDDPAAAELARLGARIEEHYGTPQDIEWARADGRTYVVQSRPITALPEPVADPPTEWPVPERGGFYFRASIVEQMPDPLTPLFADLIGGSVTRSLLALMRTEFGESVLEDGDLAFPTINGYAYYFYRTAAMGRMTLRTPSAIKALAGRSKSGERVRGGISGWRERSHPEYVRVVAAWSGKDLAALSPAELLDGVGTLLDAGTVYYTAVQSIIPLAATGELVFRGFYDRLVRRPGDPAGHTFLLGFDSAPIRAEKSLFDLATAARQDPRLSAVLAGTGSDDVVEALRDGLPPVGVDDGVWQRWRSLFQRHLDRYGHTVYNLDFADPVPADEPAPLVDTVRFYLSGQGPDRQERDPHERQRRTAEQRDRQAREVRARLDPVRRALFDRLLRFAQTTGPVREDSLADMGLAWPLMRRMLAELGRRLVADGVLAEPSQVYWLGRDELVAAIGGHPPESVPTLVAERRMLWRGRKRATAPQMLPQIGWVTRLLKDFMPSHDQNQTGATITGVAASSGAVTAPARVLEGPGDFGSMRPGEVLVARITTPAWTSLFAMAAGVVTDVGGPLSHSSIVAREYGIPAVLGTGSATGRIRTGQRVRVDGDAGTVTLLEDGEEGTAVEPAAPAGRNRAALVGAAGAVGLAVLAVRRRRRARLT
jgi:phosphohistidine swiveling domain-containing protein